MTSTPSLMLALVLGATLAGCGSDPSAPAALSGGEPVFTVAIGTETFKVQATSAATLAALRARMQSGTRGVIIGSLVSGDGGVNAPYQWHLDPATVAVADVAAEVCDGRPSDVEGNLSYWISTVRRFCPWAAKVVSEQS
ncbi:MAG: hypothetical protein ABI910_03840 [Gemmatimonadota bacterium]